MNPRIVDYIQRHRARYTREALRAALLRDGFNDAEIEDAFRAVESGQVPPPARLSGRVWLYLIGLIVVLYGLTLLGFALAPGGPFIAAILAVPLLVAAGISVLVAALNRSAALGVTSGLVTVFVVPVALWFLIAGSCLALTAPLIFSEPPPPTYAGTLEIEIDPPLAFEGSGQAFCTIHPEGQGFNVYSEGLGTLEGMQVSVSIDRYEGSDAPGAPAPGSVAPGVLVSLVPADTGEPVTYHYAPESRADLEVEGQGLAGRVEFRDLLLGSEGLGVRPGIPESISGLINWRCDEGG